MKNWYQCKRCGCYLDPGEGDICEDCRKAQKSACGVVKTKTAPEMPETSPEPKTKDPHPQYNRTTLVNQGVQNEDN